MKEKMKERGHKKERGHQKLLPPFPKTPLLPHKPNGDESDIIAEDGELIFGNTVSIQEKIDGASVGMCLQDDNPLIRNRQHIISKGFMRKKSDTTAKMQFRPIWNWFVKNWDNFLKLAKEGNFSVYGEWMVAQHGIHYTELPDWFIAYDVYDQDSGEFVETRKARRTLEYCGFTVPYQHYYGLYEGSYETLEQTANLKSRWSEEKSEGVYIKVLDNEFVRHRYKMVREDFVRGALWDNKVLKRNSLRKGELVDERVGDS